MFTMHLDHYLHPTQHLQLFIHVHVVATYMYMYLCYMCVCRDGYVGQCRVLRL